MLNRKMIAAVFASVLLAGCAANNPPPPSSASTALRTAPSQVTFFDSEVFDLQLSRSIRSGHSQVSVKPASPIAIDSIPPRLNAWLIAVQRRGGNVNLVAQGTGKDGKKTEFVQLLLPIALDVVGKYVAAQMDPSTTATDMTRDVINYIQKDPLFLGVDNMLVTVNYDESNKIIREILFRKL